MGLTFNKPVETATDETNDSVQLLPGKDRNYLFSETVPKLQRGHIRKFHLMTPIKFYEYIKSLENKNIKLYENYEKNSPIKFFMNTIDMKGMKKEERKKMLKKILRDVKKSLKKIGKKIKNDYSEVIILNSDVENRYRIVIPHIIFKNIQIQKRFFENMSKETLKYLDNTIYKTSLKVNICYKNMGKGNSYEPYKLRNSMIGYDDEFFMKTIISNINKNIKPIKNIK
jgi:hypothetical protein